jgi:hypothetical protein
MKFIIPQNYNLKPKLLGFIDYPTAILNICWFVILFLILRFIPISLFIKIFIFIILAFPIFLFSLIGFNGENILNVLYFIIKYTFKPKLYFFYKN